MSVTPKIRFKGYTDDWEQRKVEGYATFYTGNGLSWNDISDDGEQECILYGNLYTDYGMIAENVVYKTNAKIAKPVFSEYGDVLIPASDTTPTGLARATSLEKAGVLLGGDINIIRPNSNIDGSCLSLALNANKKKLLRLIKGTTVRHIHNSEIKEIEISLPSSKAEQLQIATYFKSVEKLITLHQRKCDETKEIKKYMLQKMFPRKGELVPEIRFAGFTDDWEQRKLGELSEIKDSARIPNDEWCESGVPYIRASDISNEDTSGVLFISPERYSYYKNKTGAPAKGDVLFNGGGEIGKTMLNDTDNPIYVQGGAVLYARTSVSNCLDGHFLKTYFETPVAQHYFDTASAGGTMKHFTLKPSQEMPISYPKLDEQIQIGKFFHDIDNLITLHQRKCDELKEVKRFMLRNMFPEKG